MDSSDAWDLVIDGISCTESWAESWWTKISEAYCSPKRHYHNLAFLDRKFNLLAELGTACDRNALIMAIFFQ